MTYSLFSFLPYSRRAIDRTLRPENQPQKIEEPTTTTTESQPPTITTNRQ